MLQGLAEIADCANIVLSSGSCIFFLERRRGRIMTDEYLTRAEAAKYLKIGLNTLDKLINDGSFKGKIKIGRRVLIDKNKLISYLNK